MTGRIVTCVTMSHMKQISLRELHERTGELVRSARRLGGFIITDRGTAIARIEPVDTQPAPNPFLSRTVLPAYQRLIAAQENFDKLMLRVNSWIADGIRAGATSQIILG